MNKDSLLPIGAKKKPKIRIIIILSVLGALCLLFIYNFFGTSGINQDQAKSIKTKNVNNTPVQFMPIAVGAYNKCTISNPGKVQCWGESNIGDGVNEKRDLPTDVIGLSSGVIAISSGDTTTCALTDSGSVFCWGERTPKVNYASNYDLVPTEMINIHTGSVAISVGFHHVCVVTTQGKVRCWGDNKLGQLGNGTRVSSEESVEVLGISDATNVSAGGNSTCALTKGSGVKCWGWDFGANGRDDGNPTPSNIKTLGSGVKQIAVGGQHNCALLEGGNVRCWGLDGHGELGTGEHRLKFSGKYNMQFPKEEYNVVGLSDVKYISIQNGTSCAVTKSGGVKCWGDNHNGRLGNNAIDYSGLGSTSKKLINSTPTDVIGLTSGVEYVSVGTRSVCASLITGKIQCWGRKDRFHDLKAPESVPMNDSVCSMSLGNDTFCGRKIQGESVNTLGESTTNTEIY